MSTFMPVSLENRVQRLELELNEVRADLDVVRRQNVNLRARLDETLATVRAFLERLPGSFLPDDLAEAPDGEDQSEH